ncbi:hypothetical protein ILUMI_24029 [Ignelater luminosus]|uniref:Uncharacterized protein n=1 Tax=Ignelater luminosus TaxID=2038154 RepID=A0A8K0G1A7_IGNLU|nr:hypothetical protein ILUMI_24029 [Ignelater luminosus]
MDSFALSPLQPLNLTGNAKIISGLDSKYDDLRTRLMAEEDKTLTLSYVTKYLKTAESSRQAVTQMQKDNRVDVFPMSEDVLLAKSKDSNAKPVAQPARRIPFGLIDDVKAKLARMVTDGVIEPITKPTKWVHNIVIVRRKNNKIRLCLHPRELNKYMIRARFQLPTFDEVKSRLKDAKFFVVLDASNRF